MDNNSEIVELKKEPEFVVCHNNDDVELALDPFADSDAITPIKQEYIEPCFEDFDVNKVQIVVFKEEPKQIDSPLHSDIECNDFDGDNHFHNDSDDFVSYDNEKANSPICELKKIAVDNTLIEDIKIEDRIESEVENNQNVIVKDNDDEIKQTKENKTKRKAKKAIETKLKPKTETKPGVKRKKGRPKSQEEHKCTFCHKCFQYASLLKLHTRTHMINKGHNCPLCSKSFARADHCKQHLNNVHRGEVVDGVVRKPTFEAKCEICNKVISL